MASLDTSNRLMNLVDGKTRLAGSNRMELLLFNLGGNETFGINVFKVCEVQEKPVVTRAPNMPAGVVGLISLRGKIIPVIDLGYFLNMEVTNPTKLIITEFSGSVQALLVADVDRIVRVGWEHVKTPESILGSNNQRVTAITELPDGKLVAILDVEQVLSEAIGDIPVPELAPVAGVAHGRSVFFVDDSAVARKKIVEVLDRMQVPHQHAVQGREAWDKLQAMAQGAEADGAPLESRLGLILVDAEMPEMDGYSLTRLIKGDRRFAAVPVVMHSSLSSVANRSMGQQVGVDAYVGKFDPGQLADTLRGMLSKTQVAKG
jgi:two-component system chemotaxis response regulator CheV